MNTEPAADQPGNAISETTPEIGAALASVWRRVVTEGGGSELTLPEAATLLGSSVDAVQRRIHDGHINAFNDERGRIRISASVTYTPEGAIIDDTADTKALLRLWNELRTLRLQLDASQAKEARLQDELESAEKALEYTKAEVANLWRVMTSRNLKHVARKASDVAHEGARVIDLAEQRSRIRAKVADVREIARRRRWPWIGLVG